MRINIQPTREDFEKYFLKGYAIIQEEPEEKVVIHADNHQDLDNFDYPLTRKITNMEGIK